MHNNFNEQCDGSHESSLVRNKVIDGVHDLGPIAKVTQLRHHLEFKCPLSTIRDMETLITLLRVDVSGHATESIGG